MAYHIKRNDMVEVISGDHKGARGKVLRIDREKNRVVVEGINMIYRHVRPTRRNPQGGRLQKEAPIHLSNVLPVDSKTGHGARVRFPVQRSETGKISDKRRVSVGGTVLDTVSRAT